MGKPFFFNITFQTIKLLMLKNMIDGFLLNAKIHSTAFHILVSFLDSLFIQLIKNLTQYFKHIRNNNCENDNCT